VAAGFVEAALLTLLASAASALAMGSDMVDVDLGPVPLRASVDVLLAVGVGLAAVRTAFHLLMAYLPASMSADANAGLRKALFDAFSQASWSIQSSERDGHFQALMGPHVSSVSKAILALSAGISAGLMFLTLLASAFALSAVTAVIIIIASTTLFLLLRPLAHRLRRSAKELSAENVTYSQGLQEVVLMAEEMQVFGSTDAHRAKVYELINRVRVPLRLTRFYTKAVPALYQSVALLLLVLALALVQAIGIGSIAALGAVVLILLRSLTYGQQLQSALTSVDELLPFMHRLSDAIARYRDNRQQDGHRAMPVVDRLGMEHVRFSYTAGTEVLSAVSFEVARGESIGIVGPSGAGKSSLVQLLLRLRDPTGGRLHVDGIDVREIRRADWQKRVAYVPQTPQLIWGTVADNIRFYRPHLTQEDVERAARRAHIHDEIMTWENGYQSVIGQRASAVSGGQRQRLCLARALAGSPDILILDEPTSALDVKSEQLVQQSLSELKGNLVLFLVAHRLSTLSVCDRVMVVVAGKLQAIESPEDLLLTNDFYREVTEITRNQTVG